MNSNPSEICPVCGCPDLYIIQKNNAVENMRIKCGMCVRSSTWHTSTVDAWAEFLLPPVRADLQQWLAELKSSDTPSTTSTMEG